jgi:MurNAc alpha-1-phosphate uridylyltransferase
MILAAGRGQRMKPLTDKVPKPLLAVGGKALIVWQIEALVAAGVNRIVINHAWLGDQLEAAVGDGSHWGVRIAWSREGTALETAGGIVHALQLIESGAADEPFIVVSADIHSDYDYARLAPIGASIRTRFPQHAAHLVLVDNPPWHAAGDMALIDGFVARRRPDAPALTYANIAVFHPRCFDDLHTGRALPLFPWAYELADARRMTGTRHDGAWDNVGTPEQLAALDRRLGATPPDDTDA